MDQTLVRQYISQMRVAIRDGKFNTTPPTWRETNQVINHSKLYYIVGGEGTIQIGDKKIYPKQGDFIYIPQGCTLSYHTSKNNPLTKYWCNFTVNLGSTPLSDYMHIPFHTPVGDDPWLVTQFERLLSYIHSKEIFAPMMAQALLLELFYNYIDRFELHEIMLETTETTTNLNDVLIFMDSNLHRKITLDDLAQIINIHPNYMIHLFKSKFGISPIEYLNILRINRAKDYLTHTAMSISEVADKCGFSNQYYFSQVFKKYTEMAPTDYRKNY